MRRGSLSRARQTGGDFCLRERRERATYSKVVR